ncbi:hypothetical protein, partial [Aeromonas sobria]|uniref:hypothetical protein n=1 Tax=Aeromonas sobria TaxID=646 RepID=UPI003F3CCB90
ERHFKPNVQDNPGIIIAEIYKDRVSKAPASKCVSVNKAIDPSCNIQMLDNSVKFLNHLNDRRFIYAFLHSEDLTYPKMMQFLRDLQNYMYMRTDVNKQKNTISFKTTDTVGYLYVNIKLLEHLKIKTRYLADLGNVNYMKFKQRLGYDSEHRFENSIVINGDRYFTFRVRPNLTYTEIDLSNLLKPNYPKIVKVRCENIRDQIFNNKHAKDLAIFCPEISPTANQTFFWHEFEAKTFCTLENTLLNDISFKLVDEHNEQLMLKVGVPTILNLDIQAMPKQNKTFNVRVTSDKQPLHQQNTRSDFTVHLPQTLYLNEKWKIGLSSVNLPNVFNTLPPEDQIIAFLYYEGEEKRKIEHYIPTKHYSKDELLDEINIFLQRNNDNVHIGKISEEMPVHGYEKVAMIELKKYGALSIPKNVALLLGYTENIFKGERLYLTYPQTTPNQNPLLERQVISKKFYMDKPIMMDYFRPSYFMLYSKCVAPSAISGQYMNILKIFPVDFSSRKYVIQEFKHREYLNLSNFNINEMEFQLRSHTGELISFDTNSEDPVILNLHFTNFIS